MKIIHPLALVALGLAGTAEAQTTIVGLTEANSIVQFDANTQVALTPALAITGLRTNERILGIDFRPADNTLYAVGSSNQLYRINTNTGAASRVGAQFSAPLRGTKFGIDFNPVSDRLRITSNLAQNISVDPVTGVATFQTDQAYIAGDVSFGRAPAVVGAAYTNPFVGAGSTSLLVLDSATDSLVRQLSPFDQGRLSTVAPILVDTGEWVGFDISLTNTAFATLDIAGFPNSNLYTIDLNSGAASFLGGLDYNGFLDDIAVVIPAPGSLALAGVGLIALRRRRA